MGIDASSTVILQSTERPYLDCWCKIISHALCMWRYVAKLIPVLCIQGVLNGKCRPGVSACVTSTAFACVWRAHFKTKLPVSVKRAHCRICMCPSAQLTRLSWIFCCFHGLLAPPLVPSFWSWALWPNSPCWNVNTLQNTGSQGSSWFPGSMWLCFSAFCYWSLFLWMQVCCRI